MVGGGSPAAGGAGLWAPPPLSPFPLASAPQQGAMGSVHGVTLCPPQTDHMAGDPSGARDVWVHTESPVPFRTGFFIQKPLFF